MDPGSLHHAATTATPGVADGNTRAALDPAGALPVLPPVGHAGLGHGTVGARMAIELSVVRELTALRAIEAEWRSLAMQGQGALFRGPDWLLPWWHAYHNTLAAELHVLVGRATTDAILRKPGSLTEDEWRFGRRHTVIGAPSLSSALALANAPLGVRSTHERKDG